MDILTHAGVGLIAASPFLADRPELALGLVAGSVLPDLDAVCRLAGKQAFLRAHQSWSHALPVHLVLSVGIGVTAALFGRNGFELGAGFLAGLVGHTALDVTNTYGVAWLAFLPSITSWARGPRAPVRVCFAATCECAISGRASGTLRCGSTATARLQEAGSMHEQQLAQTRMSASRAGVEMPVGLSEHNSRYCVYEQDEQDYDKRKGIDCGDQN